MKTNKRFSSAYQIKTCFPHEVCAYAFTSNHNSRNDSNQNSNQSTCFLQNDMKMTKKVQIRGREMLEYGVVAKLQRLIVSQRK